MGPRALSGCSIISFVILFAGCESDPPVCECFEIPFGYLAGTIAGVGEDCVPPPGGCPERPSPPKPCEQLETEGIVHFRGEIIDCNFECPPDDPKVGFACCECDPLLCRPDANCFMEQPTPTGDSSSCMRCHNGSSAEDYAGQGIANPHPFGEAVLIACETCHGGIADGDGKYGSHVPPPPAIGNRSNLIEDETAYFNARTQVGLDLVADYFGAMGSTSYSHPSGEAWSGLDYLQFVNPGDLRVVGAGRGCGADGCHQALGAQLTRGPIGTGAGIIAGALYGAGVENSVHFDAGDPSAWYWDTAAEFGPRAVADPLYFEEGGAAVGRVPHLEALPEEASVGGILAGSDAYTSGALAAGQVDGHPNDQGRIQSGTALATVFRQSLSVACGSCHGTSAGPNNNHGELRRGGCTACHMRTVADGRSRSTDPNVLKLEPAGEVLVAPERPHPEMHVIQSRAETADGVYTRGITDVSCVSCHMGSNYTVLQYWGLRVDQNRDLEGDTQYPANPNTYVNARGDTRLFDPAADNRTFGGLDWDQLILFEDYDGDARDDTPPDIHYEAGLGCIDCHGAAELHNSGGEIWSRRGQGVSVRCESCHGSISELAQVVACNETECAVDSKGNVLDHVTRDSRGDLWLRSKVTGVSHFVPQTRDTVYRSDRVNPLTQQAVYNPVASYAMGRINGTLADGVGPIQTDASLYREGFAHTDSLECTACHAAWTNTCIGCHLQGEYDSQATEHSPITGEPVVVKAETSVAYQSPLFFFLGVGPRGKIIKMTPQGAFFGYTDLEGDTSPTFAFSDRNGNGNNPNRGSGVPSLGHYAMAAHSIRGRVTDENEGPTYCNGCHLTTDAINSLGPAYDSFRQVLADNDHAAYEAGEFAEQLSVQIGENTGNQNNNPFWVHMVAGLGTGLFWFDDNGCANNPLDSRDGRAGCGGISPQAQFDPTRVAYSVDEVVERNGQSNGSNIHPMQSVDPEKSLRDGALFPELSGPLGQTLIERLADPNGLVLDSWIDANGQSQGDAPNYIQ